MTGIIFCAGGNDKGVADNSTEFYELTNRMWIPAAPMKRRRSDLGLASVGGKIFAIGGWTDFGKRLSSVEAYNPESDIWHKCASMNTSRSQIAVTKCHRDNAIYAIGGEGRLNSVQRIVERYDAFTNRWTTAPKMHEKRWNASACSRIEDGCIYAVGGYDSLNGGALGSCERFDPRSGQWMKIAGTGQRRYGAAVCTLDDGKIYLVGGTNEKMAPLATCEYYDAIMDRWEPSPSMKYARNFFGVAPFDDGRFLYAIGGGAELIEVYDLRTQVWSISDLRSVRKRSRHAVVFCGSIY